MQTANILAVHDAADRVYMANESRLRNMTVHGRADFWQAVVRLTRAGYEAGLRDMALIDHVNTMLGG